MKRRFRGVRADKLEAHYDVVIIGAGIGGLTCANLLALAGQKVLLVESHFRVGGYCSVFQQQGYTFDAATHFYPLLGNTDTLTGKLIKKMGVTTQWVKMDPVDYFHLPDGSRFTVSADFDSYLARLKKQFPNQCQAIDDFFHEVREAYLFGLLYYFKDRYSPQLDCYVKLSLRDAIDAHFDDRRLKLILTADCAHWGSAPKNTSFVFDSMLRLSYFLNNYYPVGGSQAFADELAQRFEQAGGQVLMFSEVKKIRVRNQAVEGVEIESGSPKRRQRYQVKADFVVSNADMLHTLEDLLEPGLMTEELAQAKTLKPTMSCFMSHIGVHGISTGQLEQAQGYYWQEWDTDQVGSTALKCKLFVPTLYEPALAPAGGHVLLVQKVLDLDYANINDWPAHKREVEHRIEGYLQDILPALEQHIVVKSSATAMTSYRYTRNYQGAMLGWEMSPQQLGEQRPGISTPINGLYLTGHWVRPGGGITPVIVSAQQVADKILVFSD